MHVGGTTGTVPEPQRTPAKTVPKRRLKKRQGRCEVAIALNALRGARGGGAARDLHETPGGCTMAVVRLNGGRVPLVSERTGVPRTGA
jgi:hypothetical protein